MLGHRWLHTCIVPNGHPSKNNRQQLYINRFQNIELIYIYETTTWPSLYGHDLSHNIYLFTSLDPPNKLRSWSYYHHIQIFAKRRSNEFWWQCTAGGSSWSELSRGWTYVPSSDLIKSEMQTPDRPNTVRMGFWDTHLIKREMYYMYIYIFFGGLVF